MTKYRRKETIKAVKFEGSKKKYPSWFNKLVEEGKIEIYPNGGQECAKVHEKYSESIAYHGYYIGKDKSGLFHMHPDVFEKMYEEA